MNLRERLKKEPIVFLSAKMWEFAKGHRGTVLFYLSLALVASVIWMTRPIMFGKMLNEIQINGLSSENISWVLLFLFSLFMIDLLGWAFHGPSRVIENATAFKIDRAYKKFLYNAVLSLPLAWHSDHDSGDTIDKVNKATDALFRFSRHSFNIVRVIVRIIGTTCILWFFSPYLAIAADVLLLLSFYAIFKFDLKLVPQYKAINVFENKSAARVYDSISNVTTVKVLAIESPILENINKSWGLSYGLYKKNKILVELKWFFGGMFFNCIVVLPLVFYVYYNYSHGLAILAGTISTIYMLLDNMNDVYFTFAGMYEEMMIDKTRMQNVEEIEKEYAKRNINKRKVFNNWDKVSIRNLNFNYEVGGLQILDNFSLDLHKGERVAIIGESGSGKSTVLKLIHGMYEKVKVDIQVDGKTFENTSFAKLDFKSTLVPQEPEVFSASIKENLTLLIDFKDEEIYQATDMAVFSDVIENLPNKIDSVVNEKGVNLSGGQKQRLALSRALLFSKEKHLILLDESTSSVDPINEVKIYQNIFAKFKEATILASIHKMNLLKYFDRILIMEKGKIIDEGSFEGLLAKNTEFKKAWEEYIKNNIEALN